MTKGPKYERMVDEAFSDDIRSALNCLRNGEVLLYPTDTVWGLGCDANHTQAVEKLKHIKGRGDDKAFIVLIDDLNKLGRIVKHVPEMAYEIMELSPAPVTIIFDEGVNVAPGVAASDGSLAVRCVKDEFCRQLIYGLNKPIVSTSANLTGQKTPGIFTEISPEIIQQAGYVVKWRQQDQRNNPPSSIIRLRNNGEIQILRK